MWWGADATGSSDSTPMFNAASKAILAASQGGAMIRIPCGTFLFNSTWIHASTQLSKIQGCGAATQLEWNGNNSTPLLQLLGNIQTEVSNFNVTAVATMLEAIEIQDKSTSPTATSSDMDIHDIQIYGEGMTTRGILVSDAGTDANNDFHKFSKVRINGYSESGIKLIGGQSYSHQFYDCQFIGTQGGTGQYGVWSALDTASSTFSSSFRWRGGGIGASLWDFKIDGVTVDPIHIEDIDDETASGVSSGGLLYTRSYNTVYINGGRWTYNGNQTTATMIDAVAQSVSISNLWAQSGGNPGAHIAVNFNGTMGQYPGLLTLDGLHTSQAKGPNMTIAGLLPSVSPAAFINAATWQDGTTGANGHFYPSTYTTGTVTCNGTTTLVGAGTTWTSAMQGTYPSQSAVQVGGANYNIATVNSTTGITLSENCPSVSGSSYTLGYGAATLQIDTINASNVNTNTLTSTGAANFNNGITVVNGISLNSGNFGAGGTVTLNTTNGTFLILQSFSLAQANAASPSTGDICRINNSNTSTQGATISGTGANSVIAYYNGSNWIVVSPAQ